MTDVTRHWLPIRSNVEKKLEALLTQIDALARFEPVLIIFEDAHWTDPTSLELVGRIVDRIVALRVLLIITYRPEFEAPWIGLPHVTAITINRLGPKDINAIINRIVGNKFLPPDVRDDMIERTDGIPLFIEEMTKALLEADSEEEARRTTAATPSPRLEIPATLHASLMSRLDRLGPAKELAQIGAAIGREFSHALIEAVAGKSQLELDTAFHRLMGVGLLFRQGAPPYANYVFKHALVQDAAYSTLLREGRRELHTKIAEALESRFPDNVEHQPEVLARHCTEAGLIEKAARLWGKAGQRSSERSALVEASDQLTRALNQIATLPDTPELRREEIKLQVALIAPLIHIKGHPAKETKAAEERARDLIERAEARNEAPEDPLLLYSVLWSLWAATLVAFDGDTSRDRAAHFLALAEKKGASVPIMIGHRITAPSLLYSGEFAMSRQHCDRAIALYNPAEHRQLATRFGQDVRVTSLLYRSWALWLLGYPESSLVDAEHAVADAREIGQDATLIYSLLYASWTDLNCGKYPAAEARLDEAVALANQRGAFYWNAVGTMHRGWFSAVLSRILPIAMRIETRLLRAV